MYTCTCLVEAAAGQQARHPPQTHVCVHMHMHMHTCMCICTCTCMHTCTHTYTAEVPTPRPRPSLPCSRLVVRGEVTAFDALLAWLRARRDAPLSPEVSPEAGRPGCNRSDRTPANRSDQAGNRSDH